MTTALINPPSLDDICKKSGMSASEVTAFIDLVERSTQPLSKRIRVVENGVARSYAVERRGIGILKTDYGRFWHYSFAIDDQWERYSVIVKADINKEHLVPEFTDPEPIVLRTDSGCETGQIFGDNTCECKDQLKFAMKTLMEPTQGMIIFIPRQDGRGMGLPFKLATLWIQDFLNLDTVEAATLLAHGRDIDARTYSGVICVLKFFNILHTHKISLATNNPEKAKVLTENNYTVMDYTSVVIEPNQHTHAHLAAKEKHLGHQGLTNKHPGR